MSRDRRRLACPREAPGAAISRGSELDPEAPDYGGDQRRSPPRTMFQARAGFNAKTFRSPVKGLTWRICVAQKQLRRVTSRTHATHVSNTQASNETIWCGILLLHRHVRAVPILKAGAQARKLRDRPTCGSVSAGMKTATGPTDRQKASRLAAKRKRVPARRCAGTQAWRIRRSARCAGGRPNRSRGPC